MADSGIQYDDDGFFARKIEQRVTGIDKGIEEILKILKGELDATLDKIKATPLQVALAPKQAKSIEQLIQVTQQQNKAAASSTKQRTTTQQSGSGAAAQANQNNASNRSNTAQRDANGRFVGSNPQNQSQSQNEQRDRNEKGQFVKTAKTIGTLEDVANKLQRNMPSLNQQGVDPTLDALNEVKTLVSPLGKMAGLVLKPLTGLAKMRKRSEPLPKEQADHNRKQLRVLQYIGDGIQKIKGSRAGGMFGGLGNLLKKGKGIPILGSLLAMASLSNWGEQTTQEKGGTVGSIAGGAVGGVIGSVLGPVGTVIGAGIGAWVGDELGKEVAPYFEKWTSQLEVANLPKQIISEWKTLVSDLWKAFKQQIANLIPEPIKETAQNIGEWVSEKYNQLKEQVGIPMTTHPEAIQHTGGDIEKMEPIALTDIGSKITPPGGASSPKSAAVAPGGVTDPRTVAIIGSTGRSTGPHLDIRYPTQYAKDNGLMKDGKRMAVSDELLSRFVMNGKPLNKKDSNSSYGMRTMGGKREFHEGYDFRAKTGTPLTTTHPIKDVRKFWDAKGGGWVSNVTFEDGQQVNLLHQDESFKTKVPTGASRVQAKQNTTAAPKAGQSNQAKTSANGKGIKRVLEVGAGYNIVELEDGSQVKQTGNWNWRNNNPGNLEFGDLARKHGAIAPEKVAATGKGKSKADRFAVFPTYEAGRAAKSELIFESERAKDLSTKADYGKGLGYKNKTLKQAITAYAPPEDNNDTAAYQKRVLDAVGGQNKKMKDYTKAEREAILNAMQKMEGANNVKQQVLKKGVEKAQQPTAKQQIDAKAQQVVNQANQAFKSAAQPNSKQTEPQPQPIKHKIPATQTAQPKNTTNETPKVVAHNTAPNDNVGQNVSDRTLAHAITGGIGGHSGWEKG